MPKFWFPTKTISSQKIPTFLIIKIFLTGLLSLGTNRVVAETVLSCNIPNVNQDNINTAIADYKQLDAMVANRVAISNRSRTNLIRDFEPTVQVTNQGIEGEEGNLVGALGIIASSLVEQFQAQGLNEAEANTASIVSITRWATLSAAASSAEVVREIKESVIEAIEEDNQATITQISDTELLNTLAGLQESSLQTLGLSPEEIEIASQGQIIPQAEGSLFDQVRSVNQTQAGSIPRLEAQRKIFEIQTQTELELDNIRQGNQSNLAPGTKLRFRYRLDNQGEQPLIVSLPNIQTLMENGLTGAAEVTGVVYGLSTETVESSQTITDVAQDVSIPEGESLEFEIQVVTTEVPENIISTIDIDLTGNCSQSNTAAAIGLIPSITPDDDDDDDLIDPNGTITGCSGEILADYQGFSVGIYDIDPNDPTESEIGGLTPLTTTELPDEPDNDVPEGIEPNTTNSNPFFLTNSGQGEYSFLFDGEAGQLDQGRNFIMLVDPGENSIYEQRRIKITIGDRQGRVVQYTATSLDGKPIAALDSRTTITGDIVLVEDAEQVGLNFAAFDLATHVCDAEEIAITKTGDRAAAEPGDIVLYRLSIRNLATVPLTNLQITDILPTGFSLEKNSVRGEINSELVSVATTQNDRQVNFFANVTLPVTGILNLVYAVQVTPDALRGSGENSAIVNAERTDNSLAVKDGPAIHSLRLEPGILQDAGTLIGRVFVDKNFDGEQQLEEPGIPNAVLYLEDGNRVITDAEGLFSVTNLLPGHHTGTLDLTSIPDYRLAPNLRFSERNSTSRLVNLEPGGMVRMNFGVTPTATED